MGSVFEYITIEAAAEALNLSVRTIYRYIKQGHLTTAKHGQKQLVSREDVRLLLEINKKELPYAINKLTIARLDAKIKTLEKQMDAVMRILDIRHQPLELKAQELSGLHEMAKHQLTVPWSPADEDVWMNTFLRIRIEDFEKIAKVVHEEDPWRPFLALAKAMVEVPHETGRKMMLSSGKTNLERIACLWSQKITGKGVKKAAVLMDSDEKQVGKLVKKVKKGRAKNS